MRGDRNRVISQGKQNVTALLVCVAGIALNILLGTLISSFGLPLYLDTVGTITVAVIGGYLPGVLVGFVTNIIKSFSNPTSLYYGSLNVLIAVFAVRLSRRGWHKKPLGIAGMIAVFTMIGGGLGALIPLFMEGVSSDVESLSEIISGTGFLSPEVSYFLSKLIVDLPDKTLAVFLTLIILHMIPQRFYGRLGFTGWVQKPVSEADALMPGGTHVRVLSLRSKILSVLGISLISVSAVAAGIGMRVYQKTIENEHSRLAKGTARIAASVLDARSIEGYLENGRDAEGYAETEKLLREILNSSTDIAYLYVYQVREDGCHVVFDIDVGDVRAEEVGTVIPFEQSISDHLPDLLAGRPIDPFITNDRYGHLLTAYHPVYDPSGKCVCYAVADVDMSLLESMERDFLAEMVTVFLGFLILFCVFWFWMVQYNLILPVTTITKFVDGLSDTANTQEAIDEQVKRFRNIDIHTGDELEELYRSLCRMTVSQAEQMRNVRKLSDSTAKMQDGLIITMANMVENRDSDTGAHIQKTAAYVKVIVEGLQKKGYYAGKISDKFISDVVRSAPLHDVGKIHIPDEVLNKPGKLTEEEYEIMKTHTVAGKIIMENAISTVEGENYLKEARNMAAYHHERWDGSGYPEGLHGEVIPLSARIMAIADVFDALTSRRIYKPAFPLDKALEIIEEGKGTQFDPRCVEVFMESLAEVKVILKKYNNQDE